LLFVERFLSRFKLWKTPKSYLPSGLALELIVLFGARDKEGGGLSESIKTGEVHVSAIEQVKGAGLQSELVEKVDIVNVAAAVHSRCTPCWNWGE